MASIQCIRQALSTLAMRHGHPRHKFADVADQWAADLAQVPDARVVALLDGWAGKLPTLNDVRAALGLVGGGKTGKDAHRPAVDWSAPGCEACKNTGLRRVSRHEAASEAGPGGYARLSATCGCPLGQSRNAGQGIASLETVKARWAADGRTMDGPFVDPGPEHAWPAETRAQRVARAQARLADMPRVVETGDVFDRYHDDRWDIPA